MTPRMALVMICRDEAHQLTTTLESWSPFVDEMWVLDTGSGDASQAVAASAGARVQSGVWQDDFSHARNAILDAAQADWHVVVDADEVLVSGGEALQALRHTPPDTAYTFTIASDFTTPEGGTGWGETTVLRVLPGSVRYQGRIHEQPQWSGARGALPLRIEHSGYRADRRAAKAVRNQRLLQRELQDRPHDPYLHYQWGKEMELADQWAQAAGAYARADAAGGGQAAYAHDLVVRQAVALARLKQWAALDSWAGRHAARWAHSCDWWFVWGNACLDRALADVPQAAHWLAQAQTAWRRCLALGDEAVGPGHVQGRGSHLAAWNLKVIDTVWTPPSP